MHLPIREREYPFTVKRKRSPETATELSLKR